MFILVTQGFHNGTDDFLCKEITILDTDNNRFSHRIFRLSVYMTNFTNNNFQTGMNYITRNNNGLEWQNEDNLEYEQLSEYSINFIGSNGIVYDREIQKKLTLIPNMTIIILGTPVKLMKMKKTHEVLILQNHFFTTNQYQ